MIINYQELLIDTWASLQRVILGGLLAIFLGVITGLLRYQLPNFLKRNFIFNFCLDVFKFPPPLAYIPFVILFLGIGAKAAIAIVIIGVFPAVHLNTYESLNQVKKEIVDTAKSLELNTREMITKIYFPAIMPQIFTGIRVGFTMGWMSIIAAEMISGDKGLGYALQAHRLNLNLEAMVIYMIAIGLVGFCLNLIFKQIETKWVKWKV